MSTVKGAVPGEVAILSGHAHISLAIDVERSNLKGAFNQTACVQAPDDLNMIWIRKKSVMVMPSYLIYTPQYFSFHLLPNHRAPLL